MSTDPPPGSESRVPAAAPADSEAGEPSASAHLQRGCVAIVGDVHSAWNAEDVAHFNRSEYELVLVVGDLGGSQNRLRDGLSIARSMAGLTQRTLVMAGNNDVVEYARIAAELTYQRGRIDLLGDDPEPSVRAAMSGVRGCGYSLHPVRLGSLEVTIIAGRPFSMGGADVAFPEALERSFGVSTMEQSTERLRVLVETAPTEALIFLAHNGPTGLGAQPSDLWGRDFHEGAGDWGDDDLRQAIDHARKLGRRPLAVVAGHMHWTLRRGGRRRWQTRQDDILYLNAARVPRIVAHAGGQLHHHLALSVSGDRVDVHEVQFQTAVGWGEG